MSLPIKRIDVAQNSREGLHIVLEFDPAGLSKAHIVDLHTVVPPELRKHAEDGTWHIAAQAAPELVEWLHGEYVVLDVATLLHLSTLADHERRRRDALMLCSSSRRSA